MMNKEKKGIWSRILAFPFRISTFYKILIANSFLVFLSSAAFLWFYELHAGTHLWPNSTLLILIAVTAGSVLINSLLIRLALSPLMELSDTMKEVAKGNLTVRARVRPLAGEMLTQCTVTLNQMLDMLEKSMTSAEEERERSRWYAEQVIKAQEEERKRIARGLHDETSQVLASLILGLEKVKLSMPEIFPQCLSCREDVSALKGLTDKALVELHRVAFNLRPSLIDDMGLKEAIGELLREQLETKGIRFTFSWEGPEEKFSPEVEIALFRVVQEAVTNVIKHAKASLVSVLLKRNKEKVDLFISDDGVGFDTQSLEKMKDYRFGLLGMQERVFLLQGEYHLQSTPGNGTTITAFIPLTGVPQSDRVNGGTKKRSFVQ